MTDAGFFRGTTAEQDNRFSDKYKKLLKQLKFSDNLLQKVNLKDVNLAVIKPWISKRITEILGKFAIVNQARESVDLQAVFTFIHLHSLELAYLLVYSLPHVYSN